MGLLVCLFGRPEDDDSFEQLTEVESIFWGRERLLKCFGKGGGFGAEECGILREAVEEEDAKGDGSRHGLMGGGLHGGLLTISVVRGRKFSWVRYLEGWQDEALQSIGFTEGSARAIRHITCIGEKY